MKLKFEVMEPVVRLTGVDVWGAHTKLYSFIISYGAPGEVYRCSWRNRVFKQAKTHYFGEEYKTVKEASQACEEQLAKLRS